MDEPRYIHCAPYTRAKRYPGMIGNVGGYTGWPLPLSVTQAVVVVAMILGLTWTKALWAHFGMGNFLIFGGVVIGAMYAARRMRLEGRAPWAAGLGFFEALSAKGRMQGKPYRPGVVKKVSGEALSVPDETWHYHAFVVQRHKGIHPPRGRFTRGWHAHVSFWHSHGAEVV